MNGIKYLLDTNIIIGLYNHNPAILALLQAKSIRINQCAYSSITRIELLATYLRRDSLKVTRNK